VEVRSYYATTVEAAMEQARRELGPEAMLIQSRRTSPENANLGRYEVIFAGERIAETVPPSLRRPAMSGGPTAPAPPAVSVATSSAVAKQPAPRSASLHELGRDLKRLRGELQDISPIRPIDLVSGSPKFEAFLENAGLSREDTRQFFDGPPKPPQPPARREPPRPASDPVAELKAKIRCSPGLGKSGFVASSVALVGPSGVGKTSTLIKLAILQGLAADLPVRLISLDVRHPAASARLHQLAGLLDVELVQLDDVSELGSWLGVRSRCLTLVDTPGFPRTETAALDEFAAALRRHQELETQLVLRADRRLSDNVAALARFEAFRPARIVITALDDTEDLSDLRELVERTNLPFSYLATGQQLAGGLEEAAEERLARLIVQGWPESARTAA